MGEWAQPTVCTTIDGSVCAARPRANHIDPQSRGGRRWGTGVSPGGKEKSLRLPREQAPATENAPVDMQVNGRCRGRRMQSGDYAGGTLAPHAFFVVPHIVKQWAGHVIPPSNRLGAPGEVCTRGKGKERFPALLPPLRREWAGWERCRPDKALASRQSEGKGFPLRRRSHAERRPGERRRAKKPQPPPPMTARRKLAPTAATHQDRK